MKEEKEEREKRMRWVKKIHMGEEIIDKNGKPAIWLWGDTWAIIEDGKIIHSGYDTKWVAEMIARNMV